MLPMQGVWIRFLVRKLISLHSAKHSQKDQKKSGLQENPLAVFIIVEIWENMTGFSFVLSPTFSHPGEGL